MALNAIKAADRLRHALHDYAAPFSFSMAFDHRVAELRCTAFDEGTTTEVTLRPARHVLKLAFTRYNGLRVHLEVEEADLERVIATATETVQALLKAQPLEEGEGG